MMFEIEMHEMSDAFLPCWTAAGVHLDKQVDGGIQFWLRAHPYPPFLEHLSFRLGNQLFFVRVEDVEGRVHGPGSMRGLTTAASDANGLACILPMRQKLFGGSWVTDMPGWGLLDAQTRQPIDPFSLVTDERIRMTPSEIHDMAVQVVRDYLDSEGFELMSWQGNPAVDPSIWFVGESKRPEWVVVRSATFPATSVARPTGWQAIADSCAKLSTVGHFASVAISSGEQPFESTGDHPLPLWRGHEMCVKFSGLE